MKVAIANTGKSKQVAEYLPMNYRVLGRTLDNSGTIIIGDDDHGWTMDGYVIPRLGSGLISCVEVTHEEGTDWGEILVQIRPDTSDDELEAIAQDPDAAFAILAEIRDEVHEGTRIAPPKVRGPRRKLSDEQVEECRAIWQENDLAWQRYRSNPHENQQPINMKLTDLAQKFRVSPGVIQHVIDRKGAYKS